MSDNFSAFCLLKLTSVLMNGIIGDMTTFFATCPCRPVAREMLVRGSAPDTDALNCHGLLHLGSGGNILPPEFFFEILRAKSCIFAYLHGTAVSK